MTPFKTLPENFFVPLSSPLKEHYASLILIFYRLFLEFQESIERAQVVREYEDYFRSHREVEEIESDEIEEAASPRERANIFLRRLISYGWLGEEVLEDFTQLVTMNSWAKPFFEALYSTSLGVAEEYESHIVAVYSLLTGAAARENGHYNVMSAHSHVRRLIESLKVLSQNIRTYLQNLYNEDSEVRDILHIHYDLYMDEVVDRAYNRLKTSDNLSKYRPLINKAIGAFLKNEDWLSSNASKMAVVKRISSEQAKKLMIEMLKEIRDSLRGIDPILDEIDDKNRRYSKISTQKIKTKLYSNATLQGRVRDIISAVAIENIDFQEIPFHLGRARFLINESLYTRPKNTKTAQPEAVRPPDDDDASARLMQREMELKITGQLNPKKIASFLKKEQGGPGLPVRAVKIARDLDGFIRLLYAAGYAEGRQGTFPFSVVWEDNQVRVNDYSFQDHYYVGGERRGT